MKNRDAVMEVYLASPTLAGALEHAVAAFARLDQALHTHPLLPNGYVPAQAWNIGLPSG
jgi:hypothetical protein